MRCGATLPRHSRRDEIRNHHGSRRPCHPQISSVGRGIYASRARSLIPQMWHIPSPSRFVHEIMIHQDIRNAVVVRIISYDHFYSITATVSAFKSRLTRSADVQSLLPKQMPIHHISSVIAASPALSGAVAVHVFESSHCTFTFRGITHVEIPTAVVQGKGIFPFPIYPATCGEDVEQAVTIDIV